MPWFQQQRGELKPEVSSARGIPLCGGVRELINLLNTVASCSRLLRGVSWEEQSYLEIRVSWWRQWRVCSTSVADCLVAVHLPLLAMGRVEQTVGRERPRHLEPAAREMTTPNSPCPD